MIPQTPKAPVSAIFYIGGCTQYNGVMHLACGPCTRARDACCRNSCAHCLLSLSKRLEGGGSSFAVMPVRAELRCQASRALSARWLVPTIKTKGALAGAHCNL